MNERLFRWGRDIGKKRKIFFFSSRRRHTRLTCDWSSDVCSSDLCLATYKEHILDAKKHNTIECFEIPEEGFVLYPHIFYLGVTMEYTETHAHVPFLEGKSSTGRLGIDIHATAGKGDVGFCGNWTLEISVKQPVKIYKGMPIGQLIYFPVDGEIEVKYNQKKNAKYSGQINKPVESMMWKNKF